MYTKTINQTFSGRQEIDFGLVDAKGRKLGVIAYVREWDQVPVEDQSVGYGCIQAPGHYFSGVVQGTRDGVQFGAITRSVSGATREEVEAGIARRIETARKTAIKNAAR